MTVSHSDFMRGVAQHVAAKGMTCPEWLIDGQLANGKPRYRQCGRPLYPQAPDLRDGVRVPEPLLHYVWACDAGHVCAAPQGRMG